MQINKNIMNDIEKNLFAKSIENTNSALSVINNLMVKNDILQKEIWLDQIEINNLRKKVEQISKKIKINYPEDKGLAIMTDKLLENDGIKKAESVVRELKSAITLMKLIAANITSFDGDPKIWYKYAESIKRLESQESKI